MNKMTKEVIAFSMVGLLQFGLGVSAIEAAQTHPAPPRQEQGNDRQQQEELERALRIQAENERHEREMRRRDNESEQEWNERQERENERHEKRLKTIAGLVLSRIVHTDD